MVETIRTIENKKTTPKSIHPSLILHNPIYIWTRRGHYHINRLKIFCNHDFNDFRNLKQIIIKTLSKTTYRNVIHYCK